MLAYWAVRYGEDWQWPPVAHRGPKVMLINGWSGSGGDAFPFYFREAKLGPIVGQRTWGGLIGISGSPSLVDGGAVTVPTFRMYDVRGQWFAEGHGVEPDIKVEENPAQLAKGTDTQLERAIAEALRLVKEKPPARPAYEKRVPGKWGPRHQASTLRRSPGSSGGARGLPWPERVEGRPRVLLPLPYLRDLAVALRVEALPVAPVLFFEQGPRVRLGHTAHLRLVQHVALGGLGFVEVADFCDGIALLLRERHDLDAGVGVLFPEPLHR